MQVFKVRTMSNGHISYTFKAADGTGAVMDAIPVAGGYTHYDYVAMKAAFRRTGIQAAVLSANVYDEPEVAARAALARHTASLGNLSYARGVNEEAERAARDDGRRGYGN